MGYDPGFIAGINVPLPTLGPSALGASLDDGRLVEHSRYSLVFNQDRGFAIFTAHNIDGESIIPEGQIERDDNFRTDPLIDKDLQVKNKRGYRNNPWDRGHLVRRASMHWGDIDAAELGDSESFFWTNIAPQHKNLHHGAWGKIENWMVELADLNQKKVCVFTGPIFTADDLLHQNDPAELPVQIPAGFWKILAINFEGSLRAAGFLVWQLDYDRQTPVSFDPHLEQVRISTLEHVLGLSFGQLRNADPLRFREEGSQEFGAVKPAGQISGMSDIML